MPPTEQRRCAKEISLAAESKREEENAKGVKPDNGTENNPDNNIVPFEANEEEEEEQSEEDESYGQPFGAAAQGRGKGMMWPPRMPVALGTRPLPGMRGFLPVIVGADGFPMPDLFSVGSRPFTPYGPRFPANFVGPASGIMFHGQPMAGGFGMMMGAGRAPFMGGMGVGAPGPAREGWTFDMPQMFPPPPLQHSNRAVRRDQSGPTSEKNAHDSAGSDQGEGQEMAASGADDETPYQQGVKTQQEDQFGAGNNFVNDESESEDEAPRRSRHGEGKTKRLGSEADATTGSDQQM